MTQVATAVFVELHGEPFLLTAAHVTDERNHGELLVPTADGFAPIEGYMAYIDLPPEISRESDTTDIAYYRLSTDFANTLARVFRVLRQERTRLMQSAHEYAVYTASGYPASKAKRTEGMRSSEVFSFRGTVAKSEIYDALQLSPDDSIVVHFRKKHAVDLHEFQPASVPGMSGVSGGAMFAWPRGQELLNDWTLPVFVGIFHTYRERDGLIIGTTLLPIITAISLGRMKGFGGTQ